jgi:hypothetical protein
METWGSGSIGPPFLTSALDEGEWPVSRPCLCTPGETADGTNWIGGWVGLRAILGSVEMRKIDCPYREYNPVSSVVQPAA